MKVAFGTVIYKQAKSFFNDLMASVAGQSDTDFDVLIEVISRALTYLYPGGMDGQVITIGDGTSQKDFYAYGATDGTNNITRWYYLGRIEDTKIIVGSSGSVSDGGVLLRTDNDICLIAYDMPPSINCVHKIARIKKGTQYTNIFSGSMQNYTAQYGSGNSWTSFQLNTEISLRVNNDIAIRIREE